MTRDRRRLSWLSLCLFGLLLGLGCTRAALHEVGLDVTRISVEQTTLRCAAGDAGTTDAGDAGGGCKVVGVKQLEVRCSRTSAYGMPPGQAHACGEFWDNCDDHRTYGVSCKTMDGEVSCGCEVSGKVTSSFSPPKDFCEFAGVSDGGMVWLQNCEFQTTLTQGD